MNHWILFPVYWLYLRRYIKKINIIASKYYHWFSIESESISKVNCLSGTTGLSSININCWICSVVSCFLVTSTDLFLLSALFSKLSSVFSIRLLSLGLLYYYCISDLPYSSIATIMLFSSFFKLPSIFRLISQFLLSDRMLLTTFIISISEFPTSDSSSSL